MMKKEEIDLESKGFLNDLNNNLTDEIEVSIPSKKEKQQQAEFVGLTKEQVLKYGTSPAWVRARWVIFALFWLAVVGMIVMAVLFVYFTPKCARIEKLPWYKKDISYQIDVHNFKDANGDGVGDLRGIIGELDYLEKLGVKTLYLNNILDSEKKIDSKYGDDVTLAELKKMLEDKSMHIMVDVPGSILDKELLVDLLKNKVDGVMITNINDLVQGDKKLGEVLGALKQTAKDIAKKTFKDKFLGVKTGDLAKAEELKSADLILVDKADDNLDAESLSSQINSTNSDDQLPEWKIFSSGSISSRPKKADKEEDTRKRMLKNGILLFLRGTPFIKFGDELNYDDQTGETMKWDDSQPNCGFSDAKNKTVAPCDSNVQDQYAHGSDLTTLKFFRKLIAIRSAGNSQSFQWGQNKIANPDGKPIIAISREAEGFDGFLVVANLGSTPVRYDYEKNLEIPDDGTVVYYTEHNSELAEGSKVHTHNILVKPLSFLIVKYNRNPAPKESAPSSSVGH